MMLLLEEADGTQTILSEDNNIIAHNMCTFFNEELGVTAIQLDSRNYVTVNGSTKDNEQRADYYHNEYIEYGRTPLRIVK